MKVFIYFKWMDIWKTCDDLRPSSLCVSFGEKQDLLNTDKIFSSSPLGPLR